MTAPRYQDLKDASFPRVNLPGDAGTARVIAGTLEGKKGPAQTFSPIEIWDLSLKKAKQVELSMTPGYTCALFVVSGEIAIGSEPIGAAELAVLDSHEEKFAFRMSADSRVMVLGGKPLGDPIVGYGPFVMTSTQELQQAFDDYKAGRMGKI